MAKFHFRFVQLNLFKLPLFRSSQACPPATAGYLVDFRIL